MLHKYSKRYTRWLLVLVIGALITSNYSCLHQSNETNNQSDIELPTSNSTLKWIEYEGLFATKDFKKAQKEIPFSIVLPSYLPYNQTNDNILDISGPLQEYQDEEGIKVTIGYGIVVNEEIRGSILISEYNYAVSLGDYEFNPQLEQITLVGFPVIKTKDDWSRDTSYFSFNLKDIYFVVEIHGVSVEESLKVIQSILEQF